MVIGDIYRLQIKKLAIRLVRIQYDSSTVLIQGLESQKKLLTSQHVGKHLTQLCRLFLFRQVPIFSLISDRVNGACLEFHFYLPVNELFAGG